jgi:aminoglycoside phosphotransferase (APT) family kinase protein
MTDSQANSAVASQPNLEQILGERLGGIVSAVEAIRLGVAHRMYTARWQTPDGIVTPIVIRYIHGPHAAEDARLEANALRELSRTGYPAPELFLLADEETEPFIVMERLPGEALTQVALANPARIPFWLDKASDLLLRLHGINWRNGFDAFKPERPPREFAERQIRWWRQQAKAVEADDLTAGFDWLSSHLHHIQDTTPLVLVHRDYHPSNILVEGDRITAVLDWGELAIADAAVDVAWSYMILATESSATLAELFKQAYTRRNPSVKATLPFWEVFSGCKRLTTIATIRAKRSERLAMWSEAPELSRLADSEATARAFLQRRLTTEEE